MDGFNTFIIWLAVLAAYFLPMIVAKTRQHNNYAAISVVNLFLGWTFIGWVVALAWANTGNTRPAMGTR